MPRRSILACALALALPSANVLARPAIPVPPTAVAVAAPDAVKPRVEVRLLIDPLPGPGRLARVGALFSIDPGWHLYWRNPGDAGLPTRVRWTLAGAELGPLAWPAPEVFRDAEAGLTSYGYSGAVLLASDLAKLGPRRGPRELRADAEFLVCKDQCIPGKVSLVRDLDGALAGGANAERTHAVFEEFAARVPRSAEALGVGVGVRKLEFAERAGSPVRAELHVEPCARASDSSDSSCSVESAAFVPDQSAALALSDAHTGAHADPFALALEGHATKDGARGGARLSGVLELRAHDGRARFVALDLPLGDGAATNAAAPAPTGTSFAAAFLLAALGGLILNLMPCVLPVLALKVFALTELGEQSRRDTLLHAAGYAAGIELTMLSLAAIVLALRAAGTYVGWGFQFQEPRFALAITLLLVGFALNLFGVFEIPQPSSLSAVGGGSTGVARSFFDGLLAVVLATPCSAPFLGTAIGFAFAGSALDVVAIFAAIGVGLAAPLSLVALAPGFGKLVPRSGAWMLKLRAVLGFALLGSAIWTLWIFGRSAGIDALGAALGLALALALSLWVFGAFQATERGGRGLALAVALLLAALVALRPAWQVVPEAASSANAAHGPWQRFDSDAIAKELRAGRPVFVDFTAAWCLTCAVNERAVIASARVQDALAQRDFALFKADWTLRDEAIRRELARFGRAGVPLYVVYDPAAPGEPRVLSELLTVDALLDALRARGERGA